MQFAKWISWTSRVVTQGFSVSFRMQEIQFVLTRHGVAGTLSQLGLEIGLQGWKVLTKKKADPPKPDRFFGKRLALTLSKLGPTFIKLGQLLATRPDWVGDSIADELRILYDSVPALSFRKIHKVLVHELGGAKMKSSFKKIEKKPLAAASLSQTYHAQLRDGARVILKVQKPGAAHTVKVDLLILEGLAKALDSIFPHFQLARAFEDFKSATLNEIDYRREAKNIDKFRKNFKSIFSSPDVVFPKYYPDLSTEKVLTMEPMRGVKVEALKKGGRGAKKAASIGLASVLQQIFEHGFFHADPHAGNLFFIEDEGRLGFIDLGLVGHLSVEDKKKFLSVLIAVLEKDRKKLAQHLFNLGTAGKNTRFDLFDKEIQTLIDQVKDQKKDQMNLEALTQKLFAIARKHNIYIPNRYVLMMRSCLMIEGLARKLDPDISVFKTALPVLTKALWKSFLKKGA